MGDGEGKRMMGVGEKWWWGSREWGIGIERILGHGVMEPWYDGRGWYYEIFASNMGLMQVRRRKNQLAHSWRMNSF